MNRKTPFLELAMVILMAVVWFSTWAEAAAAESVSLSGTDWKIHEDPLSQGIGQGFFNADLTGPGWIAATVPGNIQADVEAAHQLSPLWYGAINTNLYEVARKDWWYRKDFVVPASYQGKRLTLDFEGVDERCQIWLNGTRIGTNAGMFRRFWFDVSSVAVPGQTNHLAVQINQIPGTLESILEASDGPDSAGGTTNWFVNGINQTRQVLKDLKSPGVWSYDWSANVWTLGIWKDVRLEATGPVRIDWTRVETTLDDDTNQVVTPPTPEGAGVVTVSHGSNSFSRATVHVTLEVNSLTNAPVLATFRIRGVNSDVSTNNGVNTDVSVTVSANVAKGLNLIKADLSLDQPALWWPTGQGGQPLYTLDAQIQSANGGQANDETSTKFGVRQLRWVHTPGGPSPSSVTYAYDLAAYNASDYQLLVNGRPVRGLGTAITLPYILPGCGKEHELQLLRFAKNAGMNFLRLNGGGGPLFDEDWYNLADELGIMIAYEYPAGNSIMENDPVLMTNLDATCRSLIKQTRNHPSIVEYIGGSEMGWAQTESIAPLQLMQTIATQESDRLFRATDPEPDNKHGPYWFDILQPASSYGYYNASNSDTMWYGEFGTASPANLEVWYREIPLSSQWPLDNILDDPALIYHNIVRAVGGDSWLTKGQIDADFGPPANLPDLVRGGQYVGAEGLRYVFDALRRKGARIGGMTSHDFSEPWPNGAGSYLVDNDGRPLMNYDFLKQALAPISLSLKIDSCLYTFASGIHVELFLVSDAPAAVTGLRVKWLARDQEGTVFNHGENTASIAPMEVQSLGTITLQPPGAATGGLVFVELRLEDSAGNALVERVEVFGQANVPYPFAGLLNTTNSANAVSRTSLVVTAAPVRVEGEQEVLDLQITNTGTMTALFCEPHPLLVYRTDLFIDNNNCFIPPGESRVITIRAAQNPECGLSLAQTGWRLSTWNAADVTIAPSADVLLSVGRWDKMCREFAGYFNVNQVTNGAETICIGNRPDASGLPYRLSGAGTARFEFNCPGAQTNHPARLRIHTADQSDSVPTVVQISINGRTLEQTLPRGLGIQYADPAHLAFPATVEFDLAGSDLRENTNTLAVSVVGGGWFSWDAMELVGDEFTPIITQQPKSQVIYPGSSATFTVVAIDNGSPPLSYQWQRNGMNLTDVGNISGSTTTNLTVANITAADVGNYDVVVSNPNGSATSSSAGLAFPPILLIDPLVLSFSSQIASAGRWATNTVNGSGMSGLGLASDTADNNPSNLWTSGGIYSGDHNPYIVFDLGGSYQLQTTRIWQYNEISWTRFGAKTIVISTSADNVTFTPVSTNVLRQAGGTSSESAQDLVTGAIGVRYVKIQILDTWDGAVFWNGAAGPNGGDGRYLTGLSEVRFVGTFAPVITRQPLNQTNYHGSSVTFTVAATDNGNSSLIYQWRKNGVNLSDAGTISGSSTTNLTIDNITAADAGNYNVVVGNINGAAISATAVLTVPIDSLRTPIMTQQPGSQTLLTGSAVTFTVGATDNGNPPLSYRWRKNGVELFEGGRISGSASTKLIVSNLSVADAGNYDVVISNPNGSVTTTAAVLAVRVSNLLINPFVADFSSQIDSLGRWASNTVNGSGLSGSGLVTDTADNNSANMWTAGGAYTGDHNPYITFDLGGFYNLQTTRLWQYNEVSWTQFSAKTIVISTSGDNVTFTPISTNVLTQAGGTSAEPAQNLATLASGIRYVRIQILDTWDGSVFWNGGVGPNGADGRYLTGLSEVRFVVAAPGITAVVLTALFDGSNLDISWPIDHLGWKLLVQTNAVNAGISTNWFTWSNSTNVTSVNLPVLRSIASVFFKLAYP